MNNIGIYIKSILIPVIVGGVVGLITSQFIDYNSLQQPPLAPPSAVFPVVWTILYILMGISYGILKSNNLTFSILLVSTLSAKHTFILPFPTSNGTTLFLIAISIEK